jgi:hypothetical protein
LLLALNISINVKAGMLISTYSLSGSIYFPTFYVLAYNLNSLPFVLPIYLVISGFFLLPCWKSRDTAGIHYIFDRKCYTYLESLTSPDWNGYIIFNCQCLRLTQNCFIWRFLFWKLDTKLTFFYQRDRWK